MSKDEKKKDGPEGTRKAEEVVRYFSNGQRFIEDLVRENERLRYKVLHLEQEVANLNLNMKRGHQPDANELEELRRQLSAIQTNFESLKKENEEFRNRQHEVERQNESLLNLYISGYQLHTTLDEEQVRSVIKEILFNFLGAEIFALWMVNQTTGSLDLVMFEDQDSITGGIQPQLGGQLLDAMAAGQRHYSTEEAAPPWNKPLACIPIQVSGLTFGVLAIYKLFVQKSGLSALDHELLELLASQSAAAILGSHLVSQRKGELLRLSLS
jgi:hypothetical protein